MVLADSINFTGEFFFLSHLFVLETEWHCCDSFVPEETRSVSFNLYGVYMLVIFFSYKCLNGFSAKGKVNGYFSHGVSDQNRPFSVMLWLILHLPTGFVCSTGSPTCR